MYQKIALLLLLVGSASIAQSQKLTTLEQPIKADQAKKIKTLIHVTGGELIVKYSDDEIGSVKLEYDKNDWSPSVSYSETDAIGKLIVKAATNGDEKQIDDQNKCNITLAKNYNYIVGVVLGAGTANLDFSYLSIDKALFKLGVGLFNVNLANTSIPYLKIEAGIGEATFDLSGNYKNDLKAQIDAGIGKLTLYVPKNTGVKCEINGFLGEIQANGFTKKDRTYTNDAFGKSKNSVFIYANGAIGTINIIEK